MTKRRKGSPMRMASCRNLIVLALLGAAKPVVAAEFVALPALQLGPYGEGVAFANLERIDTELVFSTSHLYGMESYESDKRRSHTTTLTAALAAGFSVNESFRFQAFATSTSMDISMDTRQAPKREDHLSTVSTEIGAGPLVGFGRLHLGGVASLMVLERDQAERLSGENRTESRLSSGAFPRLRLVGAWVTPELVLGARARLYNDVSSTHSTTDSSGETTRDDVKRRSPAELGLDARWRASPQLELAMGMKYVGWAQALGAIAQDAMSLGFGGVYRPEAWFGVAGSYRYTEPSYKNDRFASLAQDNLGGTRMDIGAVYDSMRGRLLAGLGYVIPHELSYDLDPGVEAGWKEQGGKTKIERSVWELTLSGLLHW